MTKKSTNTKKMVKVLAPLKFFDDNFLYEYARREIVKSIELVQFYDGKRLPPEQRVQNKDISNNKFITMFATELYYIIMGVIAGKTKMQSVSFGLADVVFYIPKEIAEATEQLKETLEERNVRALLSSYIMDGAHRLRTLQRLLGNMELFYASRILKVSELGENDDYMKPFVNMFEGMNMKDLEVELSNLLGEPISLYKQLCESVFSVTFTYTHERARLGAILLKANAGQPVSKAGKFNASMGGYVVGHTIHELLDAVIPTEDNLVDTVVGNTLIAREDLIQLRRNYIFLNGVKNDKNSQRIARYVIRFEEVENIYKMLCNGEKDKAFSDEGNSHKQEAKKFKKIIEGYGDNLEYIDKLIEVLVMCNSIAHIFTNYALIEKRSNKSIRGAKPAVHEGTMMTLVYGIYLVSGCNLDSMKKNVNKIAQLLAENDPIVVSKFLKAISDLEIEYTALELQNEKCPDIKPKLSSDSHFSEHRNRFLGKACPIISAFIKEPLKRDSIEVTDLF